MEVIIVIICALCLYACVGTACETAVKVAELKYPQHEADDIKAVQEQLDEQYENEPQLTLSNVMSILDEVYGDEDETNRAESDSTEA